MLPLLIASLMPAADPAPKTMDIVIRNVMIFDGSGGPGMKGDVALAGERIVAVGKFDLVGQPRIIDGSGLVAAPGFIDLHTHCDIGEPSIMQSAGRANRCYLRQGVTLAVTGNCGFGPANVNDYFAILEKNGVGTNVIHQVPHNAVRNLVMGNADRAPTDDELKLMEQIVEQQMKDGCWGFATGLIYTPGSYAKTDELVALAKIAAKYGGFYASHIRDEGTALLPAIEEAISIGRRAGLSVHISHIKCSGSNVWGQAGQAIELIRKARRDGLVVTADQYPYAASSTWLAAILVPPRFRAGTSAEYIARLDHPVQGPAIREAIEAALKLRKPIEKIQIARYPKKPSWQGKTLDVIAAEEKKAPIEIVLEIERHGGASIINFNMSEEDVRLYMKEAFVATASDGSSQVAGDSMPHPRSYGTYSRKIGRYSIEDNVIPLEQAIRSASGLPADILRLSDRGYLKPGYCADLVVFDPKAFRDLATFDKPHQYSTGVKYLFVNGKAAIEDGMDRDVLAGKPLRHGAKK